MLRAAIKLKYMTEEKRAYYARQMALCRSTDTPEWRIEDSIAPILDKINTNPNVHTVNSHDARNRLSEELAESARNHYLHVALNQKAHQDLGRLRDALLRLDNSLLEFSSTTLIIHDPSLVDGELPVLRGNLPYAVWDRLDIVADMPTYTDCLIAMVNMHQDESHAAAMEFWKIMGENFSKLGTN